MRRIATDTRGSFATNEEWELSVKNGSSRWKMESGELLHWKMGALNGEWESVFTGEESRWLLMRGNRWLLMKTIVGY